MTDTTQIRELKPVRSIVLYQNYNRDYYAEIHEIISGEFQQGRPMNVEELGVFQQLAKTEESITTRECFPYRNIIGYKSGPLTDEVVWIYPAGKVPLKFSKDVKGLKDGEYYIPNLIFKSDGKSVSVYAIKRKDIFKLNPETILYQAPFLNVYETADVCMGNAKVKKFKDVSEMVHHVEQAFFGSVFTHTNYDTIVKGSIIDAYNDQNGKFDEKLLIKTDNLKSLC